MKQPPSCIPHPTKPARTEGLLFPHSSTSVPITFPVQGIRSYSQDSSNHKMTEKQPVHWGNIGTTTAESAAALLEKGNRVEMKRTPFDSIEIDEDLGAVKKEAEEVRQAYAPELQGTNTCAENKRAGHSSGPSRCEDILGKGPCDKKNIWKNPTQRARHDARLCCFECHEEPTVGRSM
jgi:hypothetical protein